MPSTDARAAAVSAREGVVAGGLVALGAQALQLGELLGPHGGVVDLQHVDVVDGRRAGTC